MKYSGIRATLGLCALAIASQGATHAVDYKAIAIEVGAKLGQPIGDQIQVRKKEDVVQVWSSNSLIELKPDGKFLSYADLDPKSQNPESGADMFPTDADAWARLTEILNQFEYPKGLQRRSVKRDANLLRFEMGRYVYGFHVEGGNVVNARIAARSGRVLFLFIGSGWSYEAPNIRITTDRAFEIAAAATGEDRSQLRMDARYTTSPREDAPEGIRALNRRRIMRVCYVFSGQSSSAVIDSVTGDVVFSGSVGSATPPPSGRKPISKSEIDAVTRDSLRRSHEMGQPSPQPKNSNGLLIVIAGFVAVIGIGVGWMLRGRK